MTNKEMNLVNDLMIVITSETDFKKRKVRARMYLDALKIPSDKAERMVKRMKE